MGYEEIIRLCLERGFLFQSCEIYPGAPAGFWEYGSLGTSLRNKYVELWRRELVRRDGMLEIDGSQIMARDVFEASGHLKSFADPIASCKKCGATIKADRYVSEKIGTTVPEGSRPSEINALISKHGIRCPSCGGELGNVTLFNMMFRVGIGPKGENAYLRPETCQSIFVDFPRLFRTMRGRLPMAVAQFGKSFRNEISPRQSLIRLREFYQAEVEVFLNPKTTGSLEKYDEFSDYGLRLWSEGEGLRVVTCDESLEEGLLPNKLIAYYLALLQNFYSRTGIDMNRTRFRELGPKEKAFYAEVAFDFEVETSLGWLELVACNYRGDYDLKGHASLSRVDLTILDGDEKVLPHVFELSMGVDRSLYSILEHSFVVEEGRNLLRLKPYLAPIQVGVYPLVTKDRLPDKGREVFRMLRMDFDTYYDESGSIGRRYRRADEVGVPACVTVDYQTLEDDTVTVRDRDTMKQIRVALDGLSKVLTHSLSSRGAS